MATASYLAYANEQLSFSSPVVQPIFGRTPILGEDDMIRVKRPELGWIMDGVPETLIGDFGLALGGAAGLELDRYDLHLGTPPGAYLLATSQGLSDNYPRVSEEIYYMFPGQGATQDYQCRADVVFFDTLPDTFAPRAFSAAPASSRFMPLCVRLPVSTNVSPSSVCGSASAACAGWKASYIASLAPAASVAMVAQ